MLPIVVVALLGGGYFYGYWLPRILQRESEAQLTLMHRHIESVAEGLIPLVLSQQMDTINENLTALKLRNPEWVDIRLTDQYGRQLYPIKLAGAPLPATTGVLLHTPIRIHDEALGNLDVRVDLTPATVAARSQHLILLYTIGLLTAALLLVMFVTVELAVIRPIRGLADVASRLAKRDFDAILPLHSDDEVGSLVTSFSTMRHDLQSYQTSLENEIVGHQRAEVALHALNQTLEQRIEEEITRSRQKDHLLIQQSRLAAMGEMVHNIAHQWRQPLNTLALVLSNLKDDYHFGTLTGASLDEDVARARRLLEKMSTTVDEFREFFRPDREKVPFDIGESVRQALSIVEATLHNHGIELKVELPDGLLAEGFPAQFAQAVLNLLVNAKEAILVHNGGESWIGIRLTSQDDKAILSVEDSGGGMPPDVLARVFEPYFTTKEQGSGIGLYMAKMIVERNMGGQITAENSEQGARFSITLPLIWEHNQEMK